MRKKITISEEEIQQALKKFQENGGLIKHLPTQESPRNGLVGARYGIYESVVDNSGGGYRN